MSIRGAAAACVNQQDNDQLDALQDAGNFNQRLVHDADVLESDRSASEHPAMSLYAKSLRRCVEAAKQDFQAFLEEFNCDSQANKLSKKEWGECRDKADDARNKATRQLTEAIQDTEDVLQRLKIEIQMG